MACVADGAIDAYAFRRLQAERGVRGIVGGVDEIVRRTRMMRMRFEYRQHQLVRLLIRDRFALPLIQSEQRQRVERRRLDVIGIARVHLPQRIRPRRIPLRLRPGRRVQILHALEPRALLRTPRQCETRFSRRRQLHQRLLRRGGVLLIPHRMRVRHRLAPVSHHVGRVELLRFLKGDRRARIVEVVEEQHAADERRVRGGVRLRREVDRAEHQRGAGVGGVVGHPGHRLGLRDSGDRDQNCGQIN